MHCFSQSAKGGAGIQLNLLSVSDFERELMKRFGMLKWDRYWMTKTRPSQMEVLPIKHSHGEVLAELSRTAVPVLTSDRLDLLL